MKKRFLKYCMRSEGISLLDVLVSVMLLTLISIAVMTTLTSSLDIQRRTEDLAIANEIFTQIMEDLRNIPFDQLPTSEDEGSISINLDHEVFTSFLGIEYVYALRNKLNDLGVRENITLENFGDSNLKRVSVEIDYMETIGDGYFPIRSVTFIAKNGINQ